MPRKFVERYKYSGSALRQEKAGGAARANNIDFVAWCLLDHKCPSSRALVAKKETIIHNICSLNYSSSFAVQLNLLPFGLDCCG
jgi:hypothetical protein